MLLLTLGGLTGAWQGHTRESRELIEDFLSALSDCGMSKQAAAIDMNLRESNLSMAISGETQLSASRMAGLPPAFWVAFSKRRLARCGNAIVVDTPELARLVDAVRTVAALVERFFGRRRMARAGLDRKDVA